MMKDRLDLYYTVSDIFFILSLADNARVVWVRSELGTFFRSGTLQCVDSR